MVIGGWSSIYFYNNIMYFTYFLHIFIKYYAFFVFLNSFYRICFIKYLLFYVLHYYLMYWKFSPLFFLYL